MENKTTNTLLTIASVALAVAGLILLLVWIFGETKDNWALAMALSSIILANIFNLIRVKKTRKK